MYVFYPAKFNSNRVNIYPNDLKMSQNPTFPSGLRIKVEITAIHHVPDLVEMRLLS